MTESGCASATQLPGVQHTTRVEWEWQHDLVFGFSIPPSCVRDGFSAAKSCMDREMGREVLEQTHTHGMVGASGPSSFCGQRLEFIRPFASSRPRAICTCTEGDTMR